jgi:adenosylcobinamide-phosphate synthase
VCRAAVESVAENTSDGVVAPMLYGLIFGAPGALAYKAVNTLDSMVGYRKAPTMSSAGPRPAWMTSSTSSLRGRRSRQSLRSRDSQHHARPPGSTAAHS